MLTKAGIDSGTDEQTRAFIELLATAKNVTDEWSPIQTDKPIPMSPGDNNIRVVGNIL